MKFGLISDIHFGARNNSSYFLGNMLKFYEHVFFPYLIENKITTLLILGDTWENRKLTNGLILNQAKKHFFDKLRDNNISVKMIYGNHDVFFKNTNEVNNVDFLGEMYSNIEVVKTHKVFDFDGFKVGMISWINSENLESSLEWIKNVSVNALAGHFEIKNFEMIKGQVCQHGFDKSLFSNFEYVWSGHFHVISNDGQIQYLGNPSQTNWGDLGLDKGFHVFDTTTHDLELVKNPFNVYESIRFADVINPHEFNYEPYKDKIVQVLVSDLSNTNKLLYTSFIDYLGGVAYDLVVVETTEITSTGQLVESEIPSFFELIDTYIEGIESDSIDKTTLKNYVLELHNEAMEGVLV